MTQSGCPLTIRYVRDNQLYTAQVLSIPFQGIAECATACGAKVSEIYTKICVLYYRINFARYLEEEKIMQEILPPV